MVSREQLERDVQRLLEVERKIREAITDVQLGKREGFGLEGISIAGPWADFMSSRDPFLDDAREVLYRANELLTSLASASPDAPLPVSDMAELELLEEKYRRFAEAWGLPEKSCVSSLKLGRRVNAKLALNDVAHCIHNVAIAAFEHLRLSEPVVEDVYVQGVSSEEVKPFVTGEKTPSNEVQYYALVCGLWSEAKRYHAYTPAGEDVPPGFEPDDVNATACYVTPSGANIRVGNSPGHMTHVEVVDVSDNGMRVRVSYYDDDPNVRMALASAMERGLNADCKDFVEDKKLVCEFNEDRLDNTPSFETKALAGILSVVPSADFRITRNDAHYAAYFATMGRNSVQHAAYFDQEFFQQLPVEQRVSAESAFMLSAGKSFADRGYYW